MQYKKQMARIPIIPDDINSRRNHKDHEIVMDFEVNDLYIKKDGEYINLTGSIREEVKEIHDGSAIIHIVTEDTLPPIQDRKENHWYYVITRATDKGNNQQISLIDCIYYGLINIYDERKEYLLIGQNIIAEDDTVQFEILDGYIPCFYVPIVFSVQFTENNQNIDFEVVDRLYVINTASENYQSYDVYILNITEPGNHTIKIHKERLDLFYVSFESSIDPEEIGEVVLPETIEVRQGFSIGTIPDPIINNSDYTFVGWCTDKFSDSAIDPSMYKPNSNTILYAKFEYHGQSEEQIDEPI